MLVLASGDRGKHAGVGLHLALRERSGSLGGLRIGQTVQPIGSDGTGSNVVGNAAKNAIIMSIGRRCLGTTNLVGGGRRDMYCTTDGGGSSTLRTASLDVAAQVATSSTVSSTGTGDGSSAEKAPSRGLVGCTGGDGDGLTAATVLYYVKEIAPSS